MKQNSRMLEINSVLEEEFLFIRWFDTGIRCQSPALFDVLGHVFKLSATLAKFMIICRIHCLMRKLMTVLHLPWIKHRKLILADAIRRVNRRGMTGLEGGVTTVKQE